MPNFRRFREGPGIDNGPSGPSSDACLVAQRVVDSCTSYLQPEPSLYQTVNDRPMRRKKRAPQSVKQKKHTAAFAKRMKACGKKWQKKTAAAKAKTTYRNFSAKFCRK